MGQEDEGAPGPAGGSCAVEEVGHWQPGGMWFKALQAAAQAQQEDHWVGL